MASHRSFPYPALLLLALAAGTPLRAQTADTTAAPLPWLAPLATLGSVEEDRSRTAQLFRREDTDGFLLRSPSTRTPPLPRGPGLRWSVIAPEVRTTWNSDIPFSLNDGAMWAGRGATSAVMAGVRARYGPVSLTLAPQVIHHQNLGFQIIPDTTGTRSFFAPPWHHDQESVDIPLRFGDRPFALVDPGQSTLSVEAGPVALGASTENQWWGPGIRNAIVMSNNAAGVPHVFLRTAAPLRTRVGTFEGRFMAGGLTESVYFDTVAANDFRSLSAFAVSYRPVWVRNLTVGASRSVYASVEDRGDLPGRAFDAFARVPRPELSLTIHGDTVWTGNGEQILSLFGRYLLPGDAVEVYAEWAKRSPPGSLRGWLTMPNHTQGYTLGAQGAKPLGDAALRLQVELTNLEQSATYQQQSTDSYYASRTVRQGYTQRGQVVGAGIGPGASSQRLAADYLAPTWQVGLFTGRSRWENDQYYRVRSQRYLLTGYDVGYYGHDVTVLGGLRSSVRLPWVRVSAELIRNKRYNYLFQNSTRDLFDIRAVDVSNNTFSLTLSTLGGR